jgi:hypothetical protein
MHNSTDTSRQAARDWSRQLGTLAAERPANAVTPGSAELTAPPVTLPTGSSAALARFLARARLREHAAQNLNANLFLEGG